MDLRLLEDALVAMESHCDRLSLLLAIERNTMSAWQIDQLDTLTYEKDLVLAALLDADKALKRQLELFCARENINVAQLLVIPEAAQFRAMRQRVERAGQRVRLEGELSRRTTAHMLGFFGRLTGADSEYTPLTYGAKMHSLAGRYVHRIV